MNFEISNIIIIFIQCMYKPARNFLVFYGDVNDILLNSQSRRYKVKYFGLRPFTM